ncbi:putative zinc-binding protein [Methermicoccus shengliensis]|uniref:Zinc-binding protein n=1 Tax=Methermicoccus shengliensis TaxID=660064 RepID=A0A832RXY8_9EURY|nr:putative zinc-binding protein [Methermicoccus shengliensis]KUK04322.1 MAG: hypothetical protein XD46_0977 [Euryarchaeota archaeon 55_53]KUK30665.1 MAG: hypothetical protein XD62_0367 [Methanosarcinales archeaon 56_1174]MDI3488214.1 hypothetical protein [Methanosarcinales archaeon]MDN5295489.1 hypothetical protein [Methanosarcinales archaeon]HIH70253.1 hypothetical protein [Methermicoccus shengliensis]
MTGEHERGIPDNALFLCFGGMSNTGMLTVKAGIRVLEELGEDRVGIYCLSALPAGVKMVLEKTSRTKNIVVVDGCPNECARKLVERAGFTPDAVINVAKDLGVHKVPSPSAHTDEDVERVAEAIKRALL